jgi:hypothetical protein
MYSIKYISIFRLCRNIDEAFTSTIFVSDFASLTISTVRSVALQIQPNIEDVNGFDLSTFHVPLLDWSLIRSSIALFFFRCNVQH